MSPANPPLPALVDPDNVAFQLAASFVTETDEHLFLTGKAGSGKTTFLKYIREHCGKNCAVVAPTGIAAINAGGETMHSFLQLPLGPFVPVSGDSDAMGFAAENKNSLLSRLRLRETKIALLRKLELLIIDEVSMVRADLLDAADTVLRHVRKNWSEPFGGVQVLFIGDMYQLPPVIPQEEWDILSRYYPGLYFFDAQVIRNQPPVYLELTKIYRQKDEVFIGLLNRIRMGEANLADMQILNNRHDANPITPGYIVLCTHNQIADAINHQELKKLPVTSKTFEGKIVNEFNQKNLPADMMLELKVGAQVMFIKNDIQVPRRFYNGKIGTVSAINDEGIFVVFGSEPDAVPIKAELETWKNTRYALDNSSGQIVEEELGSFSQYPLRLAWAITVHKSQGLTLEKVVVDLNRSFAPGQVYVALSRCTTLEGIKLANPISLHNVMVDERVHRNMQLHHDEDELEALLALARRKTRLNSIFKQFNFDELVTQNKKLGEELAKRKTGPVQQNAQLVQWIADEIEQHQPHVMKFHSVARGIFQRGDYDLLDKRAADACRYFSENLLMPALQHIDEHLLTYEGAAGMTKQVKGWKTLRTAIQAKLTLISDTFS